MIFCMSQLPVFNYLDALNYCGARYTLLQVMMINDSSRDIHYDGIKELDVTHSSRDVALLRIFHGE